MAWVAGFSMHPMIAEMTPPAAAFMSGTGMVGVMAFVGKHLIHAAIVGAMYEPARRPITA